MANFNWHAVHTKLHCEQRVASFLTRKHIRNYCPLHETETHISEGKKIITAPLFTSYVFVWIRDEDQTLVRNTAGVLNFVYWLNNPAIITVGEIDIIRLVLREYACVRLEPFSLKLNTREIFDSAILSQPDNKTGHLIKVQLPSLGFYLLAHGKKENSGQLHQ